MSKLSRRQLAKAFVKLGDTKGYDHAVRSLASYLILNNRVKELGLLVNDIARQLHQEHGRVWAKVTSARVIEESLRSDVVALIKELSQAKSVEIEPVIDESLIGGMKIETPELEVDLSVQGKLKHLRAT